MPVWGANGMLMSCIGGAYSRAQRGLWEAQRFLRVRLWRSNAHFANIQGSNTTTFLSRLTTRREPNTPLHG